MQAAISPNDSVAVDEQVIEAIRLNGPEVLAKILENRGALNIECEHRAHWIGGIHILDYVIKSPADEIAFVGVEKGSVTSVQRQIGLTDQNELIPVGMNDSSLTVKVVRNIITWGHAPLFSSRDDREFHISGKGFASLCSYLNWFDTSFNQYLFTMNDIEAMLDGGADTNE